ncbi:MAG: hypothetical protein ACP5XB_30150 [Isosphaeraceae bacterium]
MKTEGKGLTLVCAVSLALLALMIVPGMLLQPTIVKAVPLYSPYVCSGTPGDACIRCPNSGSSGQGCLNGAGGWPLGWSQGFCIPVSAGTCSGGQYWCGIWIYCSNHVPVGNNCTTFVICK